MSLNAEYQQEHHQHQDQQQTSVVNTSTYTTSSTSPASILTENNNDEHPPTLSPSLSSSCQNSTTSHGHQHQQQGIPQQEYQAPSEHLCYSFLSLGEHNPFSTELPALASVTCSEAESMCIDFARRSKLFLQCDETTPTQSHHHHCLPPSPPKHCAGFPAVAATTSPSTAAAAATCSSAVPNSPSKNKLRILSLSPSDTPIPHSIQEQEQHQNQKHKAELIAISYAVAVALDTVIKRMATSSTSSPHNTQELARPPALDRIRQFVHTVASQMYVSPSCLLGAVTLLDRFVQHGGELSVQTLMMMFVVALRIAAKVMDHKILDRSCYPPKCFPAARYLMLSAEAYFLTKVKFSVAIFPRHVYRLASRMLVLPMEHSLPFTPPFVSPILSCTDLACFQAAAPLEEEEAELDGDDECFLPQPALRANGQSAVAPPRYYGGHYLEQQAAIRN